MGDAEYDEQEDELDVEEHETRSEDEQAVRENREPPCQACIECHSKRDNISAGVKRFEDIPELGSLAEVENYDQLVKHTNGKHIGALDDILAVYDLGGLDVHCSLRGGHRHGRGIIVRTLCDLVICMGEDCGSDSIVGFKEIRARVRKRRRFGELQRSLVGWPTIYAQRIAPLRMQLSNRQKWRDVLQAQLPSLGKELQRRLAEGPRGEEVIVKTATTRSAMTPDELRGSVNADIRRIAGLTLLERTRPMYEPLERALTEYKKRETTTPLNDSASVRALSDLARTANKAANKAEEWVRSTKPFVSHDNLWLMLRALGRDGARVEPEPNGVRVSYMPGETGLFPLLPERDA